MIDKNQIQISPFNFFLLSFNFSVWKYREVEKNDSLIVLKELDLTKEVVVHALGQIVTAHRATRAASACVAVAADAARAASDPMEGIGSDAVRSARAAHWKIYEQAKKEFQETGKIKGFEILNLRTMEKLWISHYDLTLLN